MSKPDAAYKLIIGNRNYSSWSLRAWLALAHAGASFEVSRIRLNTSEFDQGIGEVSPTRRVPVLWHGTLCVWDSLAICEYVAEQFPAAGLLPADREARARMRSMCAEMHSGFEALRNAMPMNIRATGRQVADSPELRADIERVSALWAHCRDSYGAHGPWLFGSFTLADAMYAPVALRFRTYGVDAGAAVAAYVQTVYSSDLMQPWIADALAEVERIEVEEVGE